MGCRLCEFCNEGNKDKKESDFSRINYNPEVFNKRENETGFFNDFNDDEKNQPIYEEELNTISPQEKNTIEPIKEDNINHNFEYTQNIFNNIIEINLENDKNSSNLISKDININNNDKNFIEMEFDYNSINNKNNIRENSNVEDNLNKNNNTKNYRKHKQKHKYKNSYSSKEKESHKSDKNNIKNKKSHNRDYYNSNEKEEINGDKENSIENDNNYEILLMEEKIKSLLKEINHTKIDKIIEKAPKREKSTLEQLIKYFKKKSTKLSEVEKAYLVYKWVSLNIEYDFSGVNNKDYDTSDEATFKRGKSTCAGYSNLYKKIGENLHLIVKIISGYAKGFNYEITDKLEESERHGWNAVNINNIWYFVESTWGAGYSDENKKFIKKFNNYFFFTPPIQFVRGHLPDKSKWELLPRNERVDKIKFMEFVHLKSTFYELNFKSIEPDNTFNYVKEKGSVKLFFDDKNSDKLKVSSALKHFTIKNSTEIKHINLGEIENSTLVIKKNGFFEINYILNKEGEYRLDIFGSKDDSNTYSNICQMILKNKKDSLNPLTYPKTYNLYTSSDFQIISPLYCPLFIGDKLNFEFKTSTYSNLYIGIHGKDSENFIEMEKYGNTFRLNDVLIWGQKLNICTKKGKSDSYNSILEYDVEVNPNKKIKITFPQAFQGPKNRLLEPICNTLKKGKKVTFRIKCEMLKEMFVFDGDKEYELEKNDDIFSGTFKILGKEVQIRFIKSKDGSKICYGILYKYNVS